MDGTNGIRRRYELRQYGRMASYATRGRFATVAGARRALARVGADDAPAYRIVETHTNGHGHVISEHTMPDNAN